MIHVAGKMIDWVQPCTRCGEVLSDYRNAMYPEGTPPPSGWEEGAHIEVLTGNPRYSGVTDAAPDCEGRLQ
jgi:hypothetical protein